MAIEDLLEPSAIVPRDFAFIRRNVKQNTCDIDLEFLSSFLQINILNNTNKNALTKMSLGLISIARRVE